MPEVKCVVQILLTSVRRVEVVESFLRARRAAGGKPQEVLLMLDAMY